MNWQTKSGNYPYIPAMFMSMAASILGSSPPLARRTLILYPALLMGELCFLCFSRMQIQPMNGCTQASSLFVFWRKRILYPTRDDGYDVLAHELQSPRACLRRMRCPHTCLFSGERTFCTWRTTCSISRDTSLLSRLAPSVLAAYPFIFRRKSFLYLAATM